jgi:membrane protein DedA with SNARE-associated domain
VFGTAITCYLGRRIGEKGLQRFVRPDRLKQISRLLTHNGEITMGALALIPPPFPFTAVVLAAGALGLNAVRFLLAVFGFRLVRFGSEAALAAVYGPQLVRWMRTAFFRDIGYLFIGLLIGASIISIIRFFISAHRCRVDARLCKQGGS